MPHFHWLAILVAAVIAFLVGALWYSALFGRMWMDARGVTREQVQSGGGNMGRLFGVTFLLDLLMAFMLDHLYATYDVPVIGLHHSVLVAGIVAVGFVIPAMAVNYLFQQARMQLFLIDAGHWLAAFLAMGAVFGLLS